MDSANAKHDKGISFYIMKPSFLECVQKFNIMMKIARFI